MYVSFDCCSMVIACIKAMCSTLSFFKKSPSHHKMWRRFPISGSYQFFPVSYVNISLIYCLCFHIRSSSIVRSLLNDRSIYTSACLEIIRYIYNNRFIFPIITSLLCSTGNVFYFVIHIRHPFLTNTIS